MLCKTLNALLCLRTLLGPANESFFFQSLAVLQTLLFFPKHVVSLLQVLYFIETSRFISCLWYLNVWVELSAVSLHVVALWKRILKRVFSACGQLLKATYSERNWPPFKRTCKEQILRWKEQTTQSTMMKQVLNIKKKEQQLIFLTKKKFPKFVSFFFLLSSKLFFCRIMTVLWTRFNFYDLSAQVLFCVKSLNRKDIWQRMKTSNAQC